MVEADRNSSL